MNQNDKIGSRVRDPGNGKTLLGQMDLVIQLAKGETFTSYARVLA